MNIAARLCASATPDTLAVTAALARDAGRQFQLVSVAQADLKHLTEPVALHLFDLPQIETARWSVDPACRMRVDMTQSQHVLKGATDLAFCSEECMTRFVASRHR